MLLDVFAKETDIREIHLEGYLLYGEAGLQQVVFDVADGTFRNPVHGCASALFLADGAEILWGDQQLFGIGPDFTFSVCRMTE